MTQFTVACLLVVAGAVLGIHSVVTRGSGKSAEPEETHPAPGDLYAIVHHGHLKPDGSVSDPFLAFYRIVKVEGQEVWYSSGHLYPDGRTLSDRFGSGEGSNYLHTSSVDHFDRKDGTCILIVPPKPEHDAAGHANDAMGPYARNGRDGEIMSTVSGYSCPQWVKKP